MKKQRQLIIGLTVTVLAVLAPVHLYAAAPGAPAPGGSFEQRLVQRKKEQAIKLDEKDKPRLEQRCVQVQGTIRAAYQDLTKTIDDRNKSYKQVDAKLWVTIGRLKLAGRDTFTLEKQRSSFTAQINDFQTTGSNFTQSLDDIQVINCEADIVGFKALLETVRAYYGQVISKSNSVNAYVINDIKTTLADHVTEMQPKSEDN